MFTELALYLAIVAVYSLYWLIINAKNDKP
jgi:hypothetical protein